MAAKAARYSSRYPGSTVYVIIIRNTPYKKKINIHFYVLESLNYLQRIKVDMVTDEFTPYLSVKI